MVTASPDTNQLQTRGHFYYKKYCLVTVDIYYLYLFKGKISQKIKQKLNGWLTQGNDTDKKVKVGFLDHQCFLDHHCLLSTMEAGSGLNGELGLLGLSVLLLAQLQKYLVLALILTKFSNIMEYHEHYLQKKSKKWEQAYFFLSPLFMHMLNCLI